MTDFRFAQDAPASPDERASRGGDPAEPDRQVGLRHKIILKKEKSAQKIERTT